MKIRVICTGTFDRLHTGHIQYLKESKNLAKNSELIVIVARDDTSKDIKKKPTTHDERIRLKRISDLDFVDKAVLGFKSDKIIERVVSLNPDIIALGHDQWAKEEWLSKELKKKDLNVKIVRMKKFLKKYL